MTMKTEKHFFYFSLKNSIMQLNIFVKNKQLKIRNRFKFKVEP